MNLRRLITLFLSVSLLVVLWTTYPLLAQSLPESAPVPACDETECTSLDFSGAVLSCGGQACSQELMDAQSNNFGAGAREITGQRQADQNQGNARRGSVTAQELPESSRIRETKNGMSRRNAWDRSERSEFEVFAEDAAGRSLPVYGRQLFDRVPTTFAPVDHVPAPVDYVLGPGDRLAIRVWGKVNLDATVNVNRDGQIFVPKVGTLTVAGLRYEQLETFLKSAIGNLYTGFELSVTMGNLRSIQVFVLGSARRPGVYTVSSLSTLVNALFASGGPSATGSMRSIQLRRSNRVITEFDVYDLLRNGDKSHDVQLLSGDVIYVPPMGPQIAVTGSVNEPGIYELKGETTVSAALKNAGGIGNLAGIDRVLLERIEDHRRRRVDDFSLDSSGLRRELNDGDILEILPISPKFENAVTLRGNVAQPGRFPWHEGLRISDLIPSRESLITRRYWRQQNHLVGNRDATSKWNLPAGTIQQSSSPQSLAAEDPVRTRDSMSRGNILSNDTSIDMMADIADLSAEINWEYAAIERLDPHDLSTRLIAFNLGNAVDSPTSPDNQLLKPGDVVTIFARRDLQLPEEKHAAFVRISGEVNAPGVYRIEPGQTLRSAVERAGGLTPRSYLYASHFTRVSTRLAEEEELRLALNQMQRELLGRYARVSSPTPTGAAEQQSQLAAQQAAISQLSSVHPTGRIVLDIKPRSSTIADVPDFPLEDGDSFYIPPRLSTVQVSGAVYNENAFRYQAKKRVSAYLKDAGGPTRQADGKRMFLIRADGTVVSKQSTGVLWTNSFENLVLLPGDAIVVPTKLKTPGGFMQQLPYVTQIISQTALTGAAIGTAF